jgi:hypothetical protein
MILKVRRNVPYSTMKNNMVTQRIKEVELKRKQMILLAYGGKTIFAYLS